MKAGLLNYAVSVSLCLVLLLVVTAVLEAGAPPPPPTPITRTVTMSVREDWDKGDDLATKVEPDFVLVNELGVDELIMSIGWDDYEPTLGNYDFAWLHDFVNLADTYGIKLRPYICYTPEWAGASWNSPPSNYQDWENFCYALASEMSIHSNILSYEIWNEWNDEIWWTGTFTEYATQLLEGGSAALKAGDPSTTVIMGGLTFAHYEAIDACTQGTIEQSYEIAPFHVYREWYGTRDPLEDTLDAQFTDWFVPTVNDNGEGEPIWANEVGFSTLDRGYAAQQSYFARAVPYLFGSDGSLGEIDHFDAYEIKDLGPDAPVIGPDDIRYLGLCDEFRVKKPAFDTVAMWVSLLDDYTITTPVNVDVTLTATSGRFGDEYYYLIYRDEGGGATSQVLVIYDKRNSLTCEATLTIPGGSCTKWNLDGTSEDWSANFDGTTISNIPVIEGEVVIFEVGLAGPQPPVADFSGAPTSGPPPLMVYFTDESTNSPTSWHWTFGDGGESYDQHPSHEYTTENLYTVSLTATNAQGYDTETKVDYIDVSTGPAQSCHVGSIVQVGQYRSTGAPSGRGYYSEATITVHDQSCALLGGVTVDITWSGCVSGTDSGVTDDTGTVVFESLVNADGGEFTCCVDNLTKDGYPYVSGDNHETCDTIYNP